MSRVWVTPGLPAPADRASDGRWRLGLAVLCAVVVVFLLASVPMAAAILVDPQEPGLAVCTPPV